jgi:deoxyribonuclease V
LVHDSGKILGAAYRCTNESINPIYISVGHRVSLDSCIKLIKAVTIRYRIPEPIR